MLALQLLRCVPSYTDMSSLSGVLHKRSVLLLSLTLLLCHHRVVVGSEHDHFNRHVPLDFSLSFSRNDLDLESGSVLYPAKQTRISVGLLNKLNPNLNIGLILGSTYISQDNDPAISGISLNGNHIGFAVDGFIGQDLQAGLHAQYLFQQTSGKNAVRTVTLNWYEWLAEARLQFTLDPRFVIIVAAGFTGLDAERQVSGDINETTRMNFETNSQNRLAIEIRSTPDDRIRLTLNRGTMNGIQLAFAHVF